MGTQHPYDSRFKPTISVELGEGKKVNKQIIKRIVTIQSINGARWKKCMALLISSSTSEVDLLCIIRYKSNGLDITGNFLFFVFTGPKPPRHIYY